MLIKTKKSWELSENAVTDQALYRNRRNFIKKAGLFAGGALLAACRPARPETLYDPRKGPPPTQRPPATQVVEAPSTDAGAADAAAETTGEEVVSAEIDPNFFGDELGNAATSYDEITSYNNYYEFTTDKRQVKTISQQFVTDPWTVEISGMVNNPGTYDMDMLLSEFQQEQRIYRMRCVEGWSMVIPWDGFRLADLLKKVEPTAEAKYVKFQTLYDPDQFPGQTAVFSPYEWPYTEGLTVAEAMNDLTMLSTGIYGEQLLPQNGAPIRLVVPWKYGFKSIKSIVSIELTDEMPTSLWMAANPREYGFYSNVNPNVPHPRWSQATERRIGEFGRVDTLMFNGYEEQVASLYEGLDLTENF